MYRNYYLIAGKYYFGYYYVTIDQKKLFWALVACAIIAYIIIYKHYSENYWVANYFTFSMPQTVLWAVLTLTMLCSIVWVDEKLHPNEVCWFEKIEWSKDYTPNVDALCDEYGNCRFSSYDEYEEYYVNLILSKIADGTLSP